MENIEAAMLVNEGNQIQEKTPVQGVAPDSNNKPPRLQCKSPTLSRRSLPMTNPIMIESIKVDLSIMFQSPAKTPSQKEWTEPVSSPGSRLGRQSSRSQDFDERMSRWSQEAEESALEHNLSLPSDLMDTPPSSRKKVKPRRLWHSAKTLAATKVSDGKRRGRKLFDKAEMERKEQEHQPMSMVLRKRKRPSSKH